MTVPRQAEVSLRLTVLSPPAGVAHAIGGKPREILFDRVVSTGADLTFEFSVRAKSSASGDRPNLTGPVVQGTPDARFVYVMIGTLADQPDSCWTRAAKIPLAGITWELIEASAKRGTPLEAAYQGTDAKGGPACATRLLDPGWR
jgi:hypothetical protein